MRLALILAIGGALWLAASLQAGQAQDVGPLQLRAESFAAASTGERLPFWLAAHQQGVVDPASTNAGLRLGAYRPFGDKSGFDYAVGAEVLGRASQHGTVTLHQLYGRLRYGGVQLTVGRREHTLGQVDTSRSLGSVTRSRNASPLPRVTVSTDGYVPVPGTGGGLAVRGHLSHSWLGSSRFVEDALLHEKSLYLRLLPPEFPVTAHAGIAHHVQWGGTSPLFGPRDASFGKWIDIAFGGDIFSRGTFDSTVEAVGANHLAMYDFSLDVDMGEVMGRVYRQFYHEDIASLWFRNVWDGIWGMSLQRDQPALVEALLWEHFRLTRQNARFSIGEERGSDQAYNHSVYRGGWTYQGRTLGVPLVTPTSATPGLSGGLPGIGNSIVVAHHVAMEGTLAPALSYTLYGTYSRNYGAQGVCETPRCENRVDRRTGRRDQWSFLAEIQGTLPVAEGLSYNAAVAVDTGEFYDERVGLRLGLTWRTVYNQADRASSSR